jgi:hypothetical protein
MLLRQKTEILHLRHNKDDNKQNKDNKIFVVVEWGNLHRRTYLHRVAVLFSLAEKTKL